MKRASIFILTFILFLSVCDGLGIFDTTWTSQLLDGIRGLNENIHEKVNNLNAEIQKNVQGQLVDAHRLQENIMKNVENIGASAATANGKWPSIVIANSGGISKSTYYGYANDGQLYYRDNEDRVIGDILYHTDRIYDPSKRIIKEYRYKVDLKDPMAKITPINK